MAGAAAPEGAWLVGQEPTLANAKRLCERLLRRAALQPQAAEACLAEACEIETLAAAGAFAPGEPRMGDPTYDRSRAEARSPRPSHRAGLPPVQTHGPEQCASTGLSGGSAPHAGRPGEGRGVVANGGAASAGEWALLYFALTGRRPGVETARHLKVPHPSLPHRWIWLQPSATVVWGLSLRHAIKMAPAQRTALLVRAKEAQRPSVDSTLALRTAPKRVLTLATLKGLMP